MAKISKHKLSRIGHKLLTILLSLLFLWVSLRLANTFFSVYDYVDTIGQEDEWRFHVSLIAFGIQFFIFLALLVAIITYIMRKPLKRMANKIKDIIESIYELYFLEKEDSTEK